MEKTQGLNAMNWQDEPKRGSVALSVEHRLVDREGMMPRSGRSPSATLGGGFNRPLQNGPEFIGRRFKPQGIPGALV
jgi:hypothetical protein